MRIERFARGKGQFMMRDYVPTKGRNGPLSPLPSTIGRILSQHEVGAKTWLTAHSRWRDIPPFDAERPRSPESSLRRSIPPNSGANVVTAENSDCATNCPENEVTAAQVADAAR